MKIKLFSIALYSCIGFSLASLGQGVASYHGAPNPAVSVGEGSSSSSALFFMPIVDLDLTDLDVRDAQNRPIMDGSQRALLTQLFDQNLFELTVLSNTHGMRLIWSDVELFSTLFHKAILMSMPPLLRLLLDEILPSTKRFVHNVNNLWITISVGILGTLLLFLFQRPKRFISLVHLRC